MKRKGTRRVIAGILCGVLLIGGTLAGMIACSRSSVPELEVIPEESSGITLCLSERLLGGTSGTVGTVRMTATATPAGTYSYRWSLSWGAENPGGGKLSDGDADCNGIQRGGRDVLCAVRRGSNSAGRTGDGRIGVRDGDGARAFAGGAAEAGR